MRHRILDKPMEYLPQFNIHSDLKRDIVLPTLLTMGPSSSTFHSSITFYNTSHLALGTRTDASFFCCVFVFAHLAKAGILFQELREEFCHLD